MHDIQDLRSALAYIRRSGIDVTCVARTVNPDVELVEDFLASYHRLDGSWMADDQPLRIYENPTRGRFPVVMGMFGSRRLCRLFLDPQGREPLDVSDAQLLMRAAKAPLGPCQLVQASAARTMVEQPDLLELCMRPAKSP